ncbi:FOXO3 protein, partial [Polypterus senegalus]|nr:FOXO3 protein [Polypterus senegalus]
MLNPDGGKSGKAPRRRAVSMDNNSKYLKSKGRASKKKAAAAVAAMQASQDPSEGSSPGSKWSPSGSGSGGGGEEFDSWTDIRSRANSSASTLSNRLSPIIANDELDEMEPEEGPSCSTSPRMYPSPSNTLSPATIQENKPTTFQTTPVRIPVSHYSNPASLQDLLTSTSTYRSSKDLLLSQEADSMMARPNQGVATSHSHSHSLPLPHRQSCSSGARGVNSVGLMPAYGNSLKVDSLYHPSHPSSHGHLPASTALPPNPAIRPCQIPCTGLTTRTLTIITFTRITGATTTTTTSTTTTPTSACHQTWTSTCFTAAWTVMSNPSSSTISWTPQRNLTSILTARCHRGIWQPCWAWGASRGRHKPTTTRAGCQGEEGPGGSATPSPNPQPASPSPTAQLAKAVRRPARYLLRPKRGVSDRLGRTCQPEVAQR